MIRQPLLLHPLFHLRAKLHLCLRELIEPRNPTSAHLPTCSVSLEKPRLTRCLKSFRQKLTGLLLLFPPSIPASQVAGALSKAQSLRMTNFVPSYTKNRTRYKRLFQEDATLLSSGVDSARYMDYIYIIHQG